MARPSCWCELRCCRRCAAVSDRWRPPVQRPAPAAGRARRPLRRPPVAVRPHQVPLHHRRHARVAQDFDGEPWYIDAPAAEQNLSRRVKTATAIQVEDPIVLTLDDPRLFTYPWIYFVEPGNLKTDRQRRADAARVPAARRHGDVRRFSRSDRVGEPRSGDEARVSRSRDRRSAEGSSGLQLLLQDRRLPAGRPASARSWPGAPGKRAASCRTCARFSTTAAGRWCSSTGTPTWATAGSGRTPRNIPATSSTPSMAYRMAINEIVYSLTH